MSAAAEHLVPTDLPSSDPDLRDAVTSLERTVVRPWTRAPLRMSGTLRFDAAPAELFARVSDPARMAEWFPLLRGGSLDHASSCRVGEMGEGSKRTCRTVGMGTLDETIAHWDPPRAYAYEVRNPLMPIANHLALMVVGERDGGGSTLVWNQYFDLRGIAMRHAFPTLMFALMNRGMATLAREVGGPGGRLRAVR